eukprot:6492157-Amphidinium_carterae.9
MSRDRRLLPDLAAETLGAAIVELPRCQLSVRQLVELQEFEQTTASGVGGSQVANGPTLDTARDSTVRMAEMLDEKDQAARKYVRSGRSLRLQLAMSMDYSNIDPSDYYDLVDEDIGQRLDAQKVAQGVNREMKFPEEQKLGEPFLRKDVPERAVIWTARWVHRVKGDGVSSRYVERQLKNASAEADSEVYAATPRLESIRILIARALMNGHE